MIRPYAVADADAVLALNAANVPEVGEMDRAKLDFLVAERLEVYVVEVTGAIVGAIFLMREGSSYTSTNYAYFSDRHERFAYVDRVMLAAEARGLGWGPALYAVAEAVARTADLPFLCAEVNTIPENPRSLHFHEVAGFLPLERRLPYGTDEEVLMLEKPLAVATP